MTSDPSAPGVALPISAAAPAVHLDATVLGWIADRWGLSSALWIFMLTPLVGPLLSLTLPEPRSR